MPKKPKKPRKLPLKERALIPEDPDLAGPERDLCQKCGAWQLAQRPFMPVYVPPEWTGEVLVVGERPGQDEDRNSGRPFTGRAGQALAGMLEEAEYQPEAVALANAVRCAHPGNETPRMEQIRCCRPLLLGAILKLRPRVILGAGDTAARALTNDGDASVTSLRGRQIEVPLLVPEADPVGVGQGEAREASHGSSAAGGPAAADLGGSAEGTS